MRRVECEERLREKKSSVNDTSRKNEKWLFAC